MPQISANDIQIEYETHGDPSKETVLLIMGLGTQLTAWPEDFCDELVALGYHVVRFDNRDVGLSTRFDRARTPKIPALVALKLLRLPTAVPYRLRDMADDAVALLDALDIAAAHVVGASMGGMIAQLVAAHYPDRTLSLTSIMSTTGNRSLPRSKPEASKMLMLQPTDPNCMESVVERNVKVRRALQSPGYPKTDEEIREAAVNAIERGGYHPQGVTRQLAAIIAAADRRPLLRKIKVPALVIHGEDDPLVPAACGVDTAEHIPECELKLFPGMAHDLPAALLSPMAELIHATAKRA